jgi:hypothetical protein
MNTLFEVLKKPKFYFLALVPLLLATSLVKVQCPVCDGRKTISESIGMESVKVFSIESRILNVSRDTCSTYTIVKASPIFSVINSGDVKATGWLKVNLVDMQDNVLANQYIAVDIDPNSFANFEYPLAFTFPVGNYLPGDVQLKAEVLKDNAACLACNGTGKVSLNLYFLDKAFKDTFIQQVKSTQQFQPSQQVGGLEPWELD